MPMAQTFNFVDFPDFTYDRASNRYRYKDSRKFAPRQAIINLTRGYIGAKSGELTAIGKDLTDGNISVKQFQKLAAEKVRELHVMQAIVGRGGIDRMQSEDWLRVARQLKRQYYSGKDENGQPFGIKHLTQDYIDGNVSPAQLLNRLDMYASASKVSFWDAERQSQIDSGVTQGKRVLGVTDQHCPDCPAYAAMGWVNITDLVLPTQGCACRSRCRCTVTYR